MDVLMKTSQSLKESMDHCGLNEYYMYYQDCEKLFVQSVTDYGICYTFNMLEDQTNLWSLESGYSIDDEHMQPARALKMQTLMILTKDISDQKLCKDREKSFKLILHLPNELPRTSYEAIDIPLGKEQTVMISAKMIKFEDSLRDFPPETRGCYFDGEKQLRFFKSYTKANCEFECLSNFTYQVCGCNKFSMQRTKDMKTCQLNDTGCFLHTSEKFPRSYYEDSENKRNHPHYPCSCLPSCTEIKYSVVKELRRDSGCG